MTLKILHTADLHLGMSFPKYPHLRSELIDARFESLDNMITIANSKGVDLFVIAGDLFENKSPPERDIEKVTYSLNNFEGKLVLILPGNHDYYCDESNNIWSKFEKHSGDNILILKKKKVERLDNFGIDANVYPAPCHARISNANTIGWIKEAEKDRNVLFHIGIAHGSLEKYSPDYDKRYYPMNLRELDSLGLDLWLLGHTHNQHLVSDKIFISGTHEPAYIKNFPREGRAWIITIDDSKKVRPESVNTGKFRILDENIEVDPSCTIEDIPRRFTQKDYLNILLNVYLKGSLSIEEFRKLSGLKDKLRESIKLLSLDTEEVRNEITKDIIDSNFTEGLFPHRLLTILNDENDKYSCDVAWELLEEARK